MSSLRRARVLAVVLSASFFLTACSSGRGAPDPVLSKQLNEILHRRDNRGDAKYISRVVDLSTGRELYGQDIDTPFIPASNGKLAVTAAALDRLGSKHT